MDLSNSSAISAEIGAAALAGLYARAKVLRFCKPLGVSIESFARGSAVLKMIYSKRYDGIYGSLHGGLLMTLADTAACFAVLTLTGPTAVIATTDMGIRFLAPCKKNSYAYAKVIKFGKTLCPVEVLLLDTDNNQVAIAQVTYMRLS